MNFLAHLYLSGDHPQRMVGNFIGDFVRGRNLAERYAPEVARGIGLHRAIDEFTDRHPVVARSKQRLRPKYRHYAPVIVDVFYDHFLAAGWPQHHPASLEEYARQAYGHVMDHEAILPERVKYMMPYMMKGNWLLNYANMEGVNRALTGMSRRTPYESKMEEAAADLEAGYEWFRLEFDAFFPALKEFCREWLAADELKQTNP
jgi:acyl carrier protein phosphodiesterase